MLLGPESRGVLAALADGTRVGILDALAGAPASITALSDDLPISRQATTKHLAVLEAAGLVRSWRSGRTVVFEARTDALTSTAAELTAAAERWSGQLGLLKRAAEAGPVTSSRQGEG